MKLVEQAKNHFKPSESVENIWLRLDSLSEYFQACLSQFSSNNKGDKLKKVYVKKKSVLLDSKIYSFLYPHTKIIMPHNFSLISMDDCILLLF